MEVETVETSGRVCGIPAIFCYILPGFCYILLIGKWNIVKIEIVEIGGRAQGVMGWSRDSKELHYIFYILILKGLNFYLFKYILLKNS